MDTGFLVKFFENSRENGTGDDEQGTTVAHQDEMTTPVVNAGETKRMWPSIKWPLR